MDSKTVEGNGNLQKTKIVTNCTFLGAAKIVTSKIIAKIIEKYYGFCGRANSRNKFFQVDLEKPYNSLRFCYEKAPLPLLLPCQKSRGNTPVISTLSGVLDITYDAVM